MVSKENKTSRVELPNELIENILSRLPSKYLLRFRCVCKSWNFLIAHDSTFRNLHLRNSNFNDDDNNNDPLWFRYESRPDHFWFRYESRPDHFYRPYGGKFWMCPKSFPNSNKNKPYQIPIELNPPSINFIRSQIFGLCDGVIACLHWRRYNEDDCFISLWNPSIRKHHWVDLLNNYRLSSGTVTKYRILWTGFGLAVKTNDYKIVLVCQEPSTRVNCVFVYSLKTNQTTKVDTNLKPDSLTPIYRGAAYVNGACHWMMKASTVIYSFNLDTNCFRYINIPSKSSKSCLNGRLRVSISTWNHMLSFSEKTESGLENVLNIWVTKDDDTSSECWTLLKSVIIIENRWWGRFGRCESWGIIYTSRLSSSSPSQSFILDYKADEIGRCQLLTCPVNFAPLKDSLILL
ncbi:hypothetical protein RND81_02G214700 [Saponaria officinalis]|uniref:F-box domain-containing protein n=1 Tax=Saponaria officinalis TaxID=3572 RepID=A0AAW1MW72_SAPOF